MEVFKSLLLNIGLLVVIAQILARLKPVKGFIVRDKHTYNDYLIMILIFSMISILSNYTGYGVHGATANTRVIAVMAGGFIGGPIVSFGVSIIASIHRYNMDINGFASLACAISTLIGGMIVEGVISMIWAAGAMVLFGRGTPLDADSTSMVGIISREFMGNVGGIIVALLFAWGAPKLADKRKKEVLGA